MFLSFPMLEFDEDGISDDEYDMDGELVMLVILLYQWNVQENRRMNSDTVF